ncbi:MAG: DUF4760 domain-containing protein [Caldisericia bacterium]
MNGKDAELILTLTQMRMWDKVDDAFIWMYTQYKADSYEEFKEKYPRGTIERKYFTTVCNFFELCGVLVLRGYLNEDLFFDLGFGLDIIWKKVKPMMDGFRKETSVRMYENFELLFNKHEDWLKRNPPKIK